MKKSPMYTEQTQNFREQLANQLSKNTINRLVDFVAGHPESLTALFALIDDPAPRVNWRAAWACRHLGLRKPELLLPYREELTGKACRYTQPCIRRELLSLLYRLPVGEPFPVRLFDLCLERMLAPDETVAVQALCIKMAYKLSLIQPELLPELTLYLEHADPELYPKGTVATLRKTRLLVQKKLKPNR